jgi:Zn-dependent peptidase ImmA (M78 family)
MHQVPSPEMENEANEFAAALLMPARDIRPHLSGRPLTIQRLAGLKPIWRVSMAALLVRAKTIGAITANQSQYLWRQMSSMGYRRTEPPELDFKSEQPTVLPEIIRLHFEELGYDLRDLATALRASEDDLKTLHPIPGANRHLRVVK